MKRWKKIIMWIVRTLEGLAMTGECVTGGRIAAQGTMTYGSRRHKYEDNRTVEQMVVLHEVFTLLHECYPEARIVGHGG